MKSYMVIGKFAEGVTRDDKFMNLLQEHHKFTDQGIEEGWILFAGPASGGGGVFVIKAESLEAAIRRFEEDPFKTGGINQYEFTEFTFFTGQDFVKEWFKAE